MAYFYNPKAEPKRVVCMVLMPEAVSGVEATKHRVRKKMGSMTFFCISISIFSF